MGPGFGPPPSEMNERLKTPFPKHWRELPSYLHKTVGGTLKRLGFIFRLVWETRPLLMIVMAFMTLYNGVMPVAGTMISAHLLEQVVKSFTEETDLVLPLALQFGYLFLNTLTSSLSDMLTRITGEAVTNHVKLKIMHKAKTLDHASFDMPDFYERLENANREAGVRPVSILKESFRLISQILSLISYLTVLATVLGRMNVWGIMYFIVFLVLTFANAAVAFHFRRKNHRYLFRRSKDRRQMNYYSGLLVNKDYVKEIRLFDLSDLFIGKYQAVFADYFRGMKKLICTEGIYNLCLSLATTAMNALLFYMVAVNVTRIADYSLYTGALNSVSSALSALITATASIYEGSLFIDNMILFLQEKQTVVPTLDPPALPRRGGGHRLELKKVSFSYPGSPRKIINEMDLVIEAGTTVALVGLNGAGKTTLIKLLTRLYDPTEGVILLDGRDIREYDVKALYRLYGIIFQDFGRYAQTVEENVAFGDIHRPVDRGAVMEAAGNAGIHEAVEQMPRGYDTPLTRQFEEDGAEFSGGQWQKLSVARAFYSDADILILDEPTASLDALAEQEIYRQFDRLRRGKTGIFVSHRLSSATLADRIIVLENGKVKEEGTHRELMERGGSYHKLFTTQAERYREREDPPGGRPPRRRPTEEGDC